VIPMLSSSATLMKIYTLVGLHGVLQWWISILRVMPKIHRKPIPSTVGAICTQILVTEQEIKRLSKDAPAPQR
jgi:hypothetical protein